MRLNGCLLQGVLTLFVTGFTTVIALALLGPAIGNVFSNIVTELDSGAVPPPTAIVITMPPLPTEAPLPTDTAIPPSVTATTVPSATATLTPTTTPSHTATATPTITPSDTPTNTATATPTATFTFTPTPTNTDTPTITPTFTPTFTPTPVVFCTVRSNRTGLINLRGEASQSSALVTQIPPGIRMDVLTSTVTPDTYTWYFVRVPLSDSLVIEVEANVEGEFVYGWLRGDLIVTVGDDFDCSS